MLEKMIALDRPVVFFDTETTGTNPRTDRIVEIACVKIHPDGRRESFVRRLDPGMPIPAGSTAIHGIRDEDVQGLPTFAELAGELSAYFEGCDLAGYNVAGFDLPMLRVEFLRAGLDFEVASRRLIDAQRIFFSHEPRNLTAAARFYCRTDHAGAHGALADAEMTLNVFLGQLELYGDLPRSVAELHERYCAGLDQDMDPEGRIRLVNGEPTINFGRNRGRTLKEMGRVDPSFLEWILRGEFSRPVKEIVKGFLPEGLPVAPAQAAPPAPAARPAPPAQVVSSAQAVPAALSALSARPAALSQASQASQPSQPSQPALFD